MTLSSRYGESLEAPKLFMVSSFYPWNVLISSNTNTYLTTRLFQGSYQPKLTFSENFYQIMKTFSEFIYTRAITNFYMCSNTNTDSFTIIIKLYILLRVHIYQYWYFRESLTNYTYFHNSYKPLLTNKSEKTFLEFI